MYISNNGSYVFTRSSDKKGVKLLFLEDGTKVDEAKNIHNNPILQILVTNDNRYIITSGKDKKVKVYDWY